MDKLERYQLLLKQAQSLLEDEHDLIANMSNISALLFNNLPDVSQGPVACMHIAIGNGVCGTAAKAKETQIVPDVHKFAGHIACDAATNSEIVIPIMKNEVLIAVLDLDSKNFARFDDIDAEYLTKIANCI